jgi:hypothetical protein
MPSIQSPQDLLVHLAGNGDPSAFYTLAAPCVYATYAGLRSQGKSHGEATTILIPFIKMIHKNYAASSHDVPFDTWYETQRKKLLPDLADAHSEQTLQEKITPSDISQFESQIRLALQINYGRLRQAGKTSGVKPWGSSRYLFTFAGVVVGLLLLAAGLFLYLTVSRTTVSFSISSGGNTHFFSIPSGMNNPINAKPALQQPAAATPPAAQKTDSIQPQKPAPPDSGNRLPVKKPVSPRPRPRISSSSLSSTAPAQAGSAKPPYDTETVSAIPPQDEKTPASEKTSSLSSSSQKKQPASLPESSAVAP